MADQNPKRPAAVTILWRPQARALHLPWDGQSLERALPAGVANGDDLAAIARCRIPAAYVCPAHLPVNDLALSLGDELFAWGDVHGWIVDCLPDRHGLRRWRDT
ncbi:MAG: hypothetical protein IPG51_17520 [Chloroflexi bacterium]|nr:hypothetical protein [Chloroflexota bacterium]